MCHFYVQHHNTYALRQSINWINADKFFVFFSLCFKFWWLKTKDKLNRRKHSTLHCFVLSLILLMTLSMNYFAVWNFSLSLSIFFISMFCGFKLCDSVIHQNHCMAISFALFFSLTLFDVVRSGRAKEHWHIFFFFFSLLKSAFPLPSYPYSLFISSWLLMLWHQFKEEKKITQ